MKLKTNGNSITGFRHNRQSLRLILLTTSSNMLEDLSWERVKLLWDRVKMPDDKITDTKFV